MPAGAGFASWRSNIPGNLLVAGKNATEERRALDRVNLRTMPSASLSPGDYVVLVWARRSASDVQAMLTAQANKAARPYFQLGNVEQAGVYSAALLKIKAQTTPTMAFEQLRSALAFILPGSPNRMGSGLYTVQGALQILEGTVQAETQRQREASERRREECGAFGICLPKLTGIKTVLGLAVVLLLLVYFGPALRGMIPSR